MATETHQEKMQFQAEVKQLLHIVVHSLYSNKEIFLRELISNASDAADKLRFAALTDPALLESDPNLVIKVDYDKDARTLSISDNGIGMSREEVVSNLGTIAKSGTKEFLSQLTGDQKKDSHLIGQFGVGFYSAFIVADKVTVLSRRAGLTSVHGVKWESTGDGEYQIENIDKPTRGTEIILHLKEDESEFLSNWRLRNVINKYSDHLNIPIEMLKVNEDETKTTEWQVINRATALWTLPKSQITDEQYIEFYKHISHDYESPLAWVHNRVEGGQTEYTSLLYIPAHAPFDMWQRDKHFGLKLYVQRVFIMDQVEQFVPNYLRFIKGVVDTTELPLNISREILQDHPAIGKLRSALTRHVLDLLQKCATDEPEKYSQFWREFGAVLKEGPAEDFANRDKIANLLRFASTHEKSGEQIVTLQQYVDRMKPQQTKIYYITAENVNAAKSSPHLEIFKKNNIEVLLLTDRIDEWVITHLPEFAGKQLQSVAKGDIALDELNPETPEEKKQDEEHKKEKQQQYADLMKKIQGLLNEQVKEVRLSHRLTDSPACLVRDQNALGPQMERLLKAAGQSVTENKVIMEINPEHAIISTLNTEQDETRFKEWAMILYEQALLAEGGNLPDPAAFVKRMNDLWITALK